MTNESSDEKLLKLIEGAQPLTKQKVGIKQKKNKLSFLSGVQRLKFKPDLYSLNKILFTIGAALTLIFLYSFITNQKAAGEAFFSSLMSVTGSPKPILGENEGFLNIQEYADAVTKRNVFISVDKKTDVSGGQPADNAKLADLVKDLKLVGIIWSKDPEVMIEDATDARTYLLKNGETFGRSQYKIKNITRSSVILEINLKGELKEYELR